MARFSAVALGYASGLVGGDHPLVRGVQIVQAGSRHGVASVAPLAFQGFANPESVP